MILAGDIGGTKTLLSLYRATGQGLETIRSRQFASCDQSDLGAIIDGFLQPGDSVEAAGFGVAGPVVDGVCRTTNLPWVIDQATLSRQLGGVPVALLNDLQAAALGMTRLPASDLVDLNPGAQARTGNVAVIAAGTGLGEAILCRDGHRQHAMATEGGHCDFAPNSPLEDDLLGFLRHRFSGHVSYERILSGDGFRHLYDFLRESGQGIEREPVRRALQTERDPNAVITRFGVPGDDPLCHSAVQLFARIYGAEAGNLALKCLSVGGVYVGGAIAGHILPVLRSGAFMSGFTDKGRFSALLSAMPVQVATNPLVPLLGAAWAARALKDDLSEEQTA
ncbi:MAG: glucokinase [Halothiobacillaceae bacterium]